MKCCAVSMVTPAPNAKPQLFCYYDNTLHKIKHEAFGELGGVHTFYKANISVCSRIRSR